MPEDNQPGLLQQVVNSFKNTPEDNIHKSLMKTIRIALRSDDTNLNGIVEKDEISKSTTQRLQNLTKRYSAEAMQEALDKVVKVTNLSDSLQSLTSNVIAPPRINITQEALNEVQEIIANMKTPEPAKDNTLQASNPSKASKASTGRGS